MEDVITWEQFVPVDEFIRFTLYGVGTIAFPLFCLLLTEGSGIPTTGSGIYGRCSFLL